MSTEPHKADQPPTYEDSVAAPQHDATSMHEPIVLVLDGQSIRGGMSDDAPALYETDRGVAHLGHATSTVELTRIERTTTTTTLTTQTLTENDPEAALGAAADGPASSGARVKTRRRHVFDLVHPTGPAATGHDAPAYYVRPRTRTTHAGTYGLQKKAHHLRADEYKVLPVREKAKDGELRYEDKGQLLFQVVMGKGGGGGGGGGAYEWMDAEGVVLAVEEDGACKRLRVRERMEGGVLDALVAMWCCRIWAEAAAAQPEVHGGMEKVRRKLGLSKELPSGNKRGIADGISAAGLF